MAKKETTDQKRIEALEKRVTELEERLDTLTRPNPKVAKHHLEQLERSKTMRAAALKSVKQLLSDGVKRTESKIRRELPDISGRMFHRIRSELLSDGKTYWLEVKKNAKSDAKSSENHTGS